MQKYIETAIFAYKYSEFMRKFTAILAAFLLMLPFISSAADKQEKDYDLKVISYNIRMGAAKDGTNSWEFRYPATALMIEDQKPDVFGLRRRFPIKFDSSRKISRITTMSESEETMVRIRENSCPSSGTRRL